MKTFEEKIGAAQRITDVKDKGASAQQHKSKFKGADEDGKKTFAEVLEGLENGTIKASGQQMRVVKEAVIACMEQVMTVLCEMEENPDVMDSELDGGPAPTTSGGGDEELLNDLNEIFTPILVMQGFEGNVTAKIQEAFSESSVLLEKNIIQFDNSTKMAQLISVCALLIARQKNTQNYQMYKKAAEIRKAMKINIQKDEYAAAQALAQKFLVKVSTTNNSSVARQAANELLPETQH